MNSRLNHFKLMMSLMILFAIFPLIASVLSFTYPQSTTLGSGNILVVEKNGIYICDPSLNSKISTLHTFSEDDKIKTETNLSKVIIKKTSLAILIFSNYKLYIADTARNLLLYNSGTKIITDDEPEYISIAYYTSSDIIYFIIGYIDINKTLKIKYYKFSKNDNTLSQIGPVSSFNSVTREYSNGAFTFNFQNKGLSCDYLKDIYISSMHFLLVSLLVVLAQVII